MNDFKAYRTYITEDCKHHVTVKLIRANREYALATIDNSICLNTLKIGVNNEGVEVISWQDFRTKETSTIYANRYFA